MPADWTLLPQVLPNRIFLMQIKEWALDSADKGFILSVVIQ